MIRLIAVGVVLYIAVFAGLVLGQSWLIYPFDPTEVTPAAAGEPRLSAQELHTTDAARLVVWTRAAQRGKPTVVYFHGNAGNLANRAERFDRLLGRGYGVVAMAYRGSSGSTGTPDEAMIRADTQALIAALPRLIGTGPRDLVYYGESLGTGVAVALARQHPPVGMILEAPYTSVTALAQRRLPVIPVSLGLRSTWDTLATVPQIKVPLLVMHGTADQVIPHEMGRAVFEAAGSDDKQMRSVPGLGHVGHWSVEGQKAIFAFLDRV